MAKRILAGLLWFYVAWYAWSVVASFVGLSDLWGPVFAAAIAMLIAGDPMGRIWGRRSVDQSTATSSAQLSEPA